MALVKVHDISSLFSALHLLPSLSPTDAAITYTNFHTARLSLTKGGMTTRTIVIKKSPIVTNQVVGFVLLFKSSPLAGGFAHRTGGPMTSLVSGPGVFVSSQSQKSLIQTSVKPHPLCIFGTGISFVDSFVIDRDAFRRYTFYTYSALVTTGVSSGVVIRYRFITRDGP